ncbi:uncharacterized protein [Henckelia pumila]|uniref:uncharacterized protein n=1 Tax=Henckelia pumila TaxID=405737 RepID=UPI003C6E3C91
MTENANLSLRQLGTPDLNQQPLCITFPTLETNATFELKSGLIHLLSAFHGLAGNRQNVKVCGICTAMGHATNMCPTLQEKMSAQLNAAGGFPGPPQQRNYDPYSNTFNRGWKDHPNLRYGNPLINQPARQETRASIQHLNTQVEQLATTINMLEAQNSSSLPSQTVVNPKENVSAITLRSGRDLKVHEAVVKEPLKNEEVEESKLEENETVQKEASKVPLYAKFLKELCTVKKKHKLKGYQRVELGEQMADRSTIYPRGLLEDVLVQVDNLVFPAVFYVLDMKSNDLNSPILLGRPFLKTSKSIIDVNNSTLTMEFDREVVKFHIFDTLQISDCESVVNNLDVINHLSQEHKKVVNGDKVKEVPRKSKQRKQRPKIIAKLRKNRMSPPPQSKFQYDSSVILSDVEEDSTNT